jgi:putative intracellular protease/amidase/YHS domain-containing protein
MREMLRQNEFRWSSKGYLEQPAQGASMQRRELLQLTASLGLTTALPALAGPQSAPAARSVPAADNNERPLKPPEKGPIPAAFLLSEGAVVIDFAGPWEVFEQVHLPGGTTHPFSLYTVAETKSPIHAGAGGMTIVPQYSIADAPPPKVLVIPAQSEPSEAVVAWIRKVSHSTDLTMSVCTGAFVLAKTGLLAGKQATTHHSAYAEFAMMFPDVVVKRGARFVEAGNLATSGGLSCGIDLALRVVERYFGRTVAQRTADNLEYQGLGWTDPDSNSAYAVKRVSTDQHPLCPVCEMDVDPATAPKSSYRNHFYYFCMDAHKKLFDAYPDRFLAA